MTEITSQNVVDLIEDIFLRRGAESYLGEKVTMAQHMLQTAQCAEEAGADTAQIVAALLHDIGHYKNEIPESSLACLLYTSPSPRDRSLSRMPSSA